MRRSPPVSPQWGIDTPAQGNALGAGGQKTKAPKGRNPCLVAMDGVALSGLEKSNADLPRALPWADGLLPRRSVIAWLFNRGAVQRGLVAVLAVISTFSSPAAACVGDCDGNGAVTIDEIVKGLSIDLGTVPLSSCPNFDRNNDGRVDVDEMLAAVNVALGGGCADATPSPTPSPVQPVFPANYRETFVEVRNCRFSLEHGGVNIRVLANPTAAQPYLDNDNPLPVGSIVVKEEFGGTGCDDANFLQWRALRKEAPGFDPADGDWHWQWVNADRSVRFNDKSTCIACHTAPECLARDHMCTVAGNPPPPTPAPSTLQLVLKQLPAALVSVTGTSASDVTAVGADPNDGFGPYVLHYDGQRWKRLPTGASGDVWWISVTPIGGAYYLAGANGLILRYDPAAATFTQQVTPGTELLFGVWGTDVNHIWAVGGDPLNDDTGGVVWKYNGTAWTVDDEAPKARSNGLPTLFKVWGRSPEDFYVSGRLGVVLHFDGIRWTELETGTTASLFTVHGNDTLTVAVGGDFSGLIVEQNADAFVDHSPVAALQMNGVFIPPDGRGVAVGVAGSLALRTDSGWQVQNTGLQIAQDFHAAWVDPEGAVWAVGGDLSLSLNKGMLAYGGTRTISSEIVQPSACPPGAPLPGVPSTVSYAHDVVPLLQSAGCQSLSCHGGPFPSSDYNLSAYETSFGPGIEAKALKGCDIVPGGPDASFMIEKLVSPTPRIGNRMPSARPPLTDTQVELIRQWITEGAIDDSAPTPTPTLTPILSPTATRAPTSAVPSVTPPPIATPTPDTACQVAGVICTVAGTGQSAFNGDGLPALETALYFPLEITFDPSGNPLIDDWNNLRIRRLNANGTIETIMGTDFEGFPTDGTLAVDTPLHHASDMEFDTTGNLYVAGDHVPVIFRVGTDNRVFTVAGTQDSGYDGDGGPALQAKLTTPFGVLPTNDGGFDLADVDANVVRRVDADGIIHTVAGTGVRGYSGDGGPATLAQLNGPTRLRVGPDGGVYFCDTNNHAVRRIDAAGMITTIAGTGSLGYSGDNGAATAAQLNLPYDLRFAPSGDLYIADNGNSVIRRVDTHGTITTVAGSTAGFSGDGGDAKSSQLNRPSGLNFDATGALWIADTFNQRVRRVASFLSLYP
jgi:hypothetical protein